MAVWNVSVPIAALVNADTREEAIERFRTMLREHWQMEAVGVPTHRGHPDAFRAHDQSDEAKGRAL